MYLFLFICVNAWGNVQVGLVLDKAGKDDKSFNSAAYEGALRAKGFSTLKYVEATDDSAFESLLRRFARSGKYDIVISIGFTQADALKKIAPKFPKQKFAIIDSIVQQPNVKSVMFEEHQGSFVVGAIATMKSRSKKVGFIGGMDIPLIRRFQMGYEAGAKHVDPKANVTANYIGITSEAWNNPAKAKELAISQFSSGVDVIFVAAGASNLGVFDAAEEKKKLAIGVDSNQNGLKPGFILTSMLKRVDNAVFDTIKEVSEGRFQAGEYRFGLKNGGIGYSLDKNNEKILTPDIRKKADSIQKEIISGKIAVPDYYKRKQ